MSVQLTRLHATPQRPEIRVITALTHEQREAVFALRYEIYVQEMGLLSEDHPFVHDGRVVDPWDDRSVLLLALVGDEPVGTVRLTPAASGPMELEQYRPLADLPEARGALAEATRFMVRRAWRRSLVGWALMVSTLQAMRRSGLRVLLVAGKLGALSRHYQAVGLKRVEGETFTYDLVGPARYELLRLDIGRPYSGQRLRYRAFVAALHIALTLFGQRDRVFGQRFGRDGGRAAQPGSGHLQALPDRSR